VELNHFRVGKYHKSWELLGKILKKMGMTWKYFT